MRKLVPWIVLALVGCGESSGTSVLVPNVMSSHIEGVPASQRFEATLAVTCFSGNEVTAVSDFNGTATQIVFADLPPCGDSTFTLNISALYDDEDPVLAFQSEATGTLRIGRTSSVDFSGQLFGELVLDPESLGQSGTCSISTGTDSITVDLSAGAVTTQLPKGTYPVHCEVTGTTIDVDVDVGAGARERKVISTTPPPPPDTGVPVVSNVRVQNITDVSAIINFTVNETNALPFTTVVDIFGDPGRTQLVQSVVCGNTTSASVTNLNAQTRYYVRFTPSNANGTGEIVTAEFVTNPASLNTNLQSVTVNGEATSNGNATDPGTAVVYSDSDTITIVVTTEDPNAEVSFDGTTWVTHVGTSTVSGVPYGGPTAYPIHIRTYDQNQTFNTTLQVYRYTT